MVDQRSRSSSRSPTSTSTAGFGGGPCLVDLAEARQRVVVVAAAAAAAAALVVDRGLSQTGRRPSETIAVARQRLTEARQRVLDRYDRKQRPPSSVGRHQNIGDDTSRSTMTDDCGGHGRRHQRLEPLTTVNVHQAASALGVQHHR